MIRVRACAKTTELATTFSPKGDLEHDPYGVGFDEATMYSYRGSSYISLGQLEAAKIAFLRGLQLSGPHDLMQQMSLRVNLAEVYQLQGDIPNACLHGYHVLSLISRNRSSWYLPWLEDFRSKFPAGETDSALQAFDEHKMSVEELLRQHTF
jgi:tetratricopeptide (TPR) repeat protein